MLKTEIEKGTLSHYLRTLLELGWIRKELPFGERSERLFLVGAAELGHVLQQGRFEHRAVALAATQHFRAALDRTLDPAIEPLRFTFRNHRSWRGR